MNVERKLFAPADGVQARWRYCYDLAASRDVGDLITLEEVIDLLDGIDEEGAWREMRLANDARERDGLRSLIPIPQVGWRIANGVEAHEFGRRRARKQRRAAKRAIRTYRAVPRDELPQVQRQAHDQELRLLTQQEWLMRRRASVKSLAELARAARPEGLPHASGE